MLPEAHVARNISCQKLENFGLYPNVPEDQFQWKPIYIAEGERNDEGKFAWRL